MTSVLFHIIATDEWDAAQRAGHHSPPSLASDGFIHLSGIDQVLRPANLLYRGREDLLLLRIEAATLEAELVWEPGSHGEAEDFPHLYGPLNLDAVIGTVPFPCESDGSFLLPADLA